MVGGWRRRVQRNYILLFWVVKMCQQRGWCSATRAIFVKKIFDVEYCGYIPLLQPCSKPIFSSNNNNKMAFIFIQEICFDWFQLTNKYLIHYWDKHRIDSIDELIQIICSRLLMAWIYCRYEYINIIWFCCHWLAMSNSGKVIFVNTCA